MLLTAFKLLNMNIHRKYVNEIYYKMIIKKLLTLNYMDISSENSQHCPHTARYSYTCNRRRASKKKVSGQIKVEVQRAGSRPVEKGKAHARPETDTRSWTADNRNGQSVRSILRTTVI